MEIKRICWTILIFLIFSSCKKESSTTDITTKKWEVKSIKKPGAFSKKPKNNYLLEFKKDFLFTLNLDVNKCSGQFEIPKNGEINFSSLGCTKIISLYTAENIF